MINSVYSIYYSKALQCANKNNITKAIYYCKIAFGINKSSEDIKKLSALCYFRLGNYEMAEHLYNQYDISEKKEQLKNINQLIAKKQYKKGIKVLEADNLKNVNEFNMLGCLYSMINKKDKACQYFLNALELDLENSDAIYFMKNIKHIKKRSWWHL